MADESRFAVYFSHSWRSRDVDLNLRVWEELTGDCELLVDAPEEPGANPPYYINRIEELLRRTDLFVSVLTHREPHQGEFTEEEAHLRCSPYALFEIRLAERAEIPRLILYERTTGFRPPRRIRAWEAYLPFDRGMRERLPEQRQWSTVIRARIQQWKDWAKDNRRPGSYDQSTCAVVLASAARQDPFRKALEDCLVEGGYEAVCCDPGRQRGSEAFRLLREAGLILADFGAGDAVLEQLYAAAHALVLPAIRMRSAEHNQTELPWILRGDPGGYQNDIVVYNKPDDLTALVKPRIAAMFRLSPALRDDDGSDYLQSKRYSQFFVFISHSLKPPDRMLVEHVYDLLKRRHVTPFEYHQVNTAGIDWQKAMEEYLQKTTHFVALLNPDYEQSRTCTYELDQAMARGAQVTILPFMIGGRSIPNPRLAHLHNTLLSNPDQHANAEVVVQQVMDALDAALRRSGEA